MAWPLERLIDRCPQIRFKEEADEEACWEPGKGWRDRSFFIFGKYFSDCEQLVLSLYFWLMSFCVFFFMYSSLILVDLHLCIYFCSIIFSIFFCGYFLFDLLFVYWWPNLPQTARITCHLTLPKSIEPKPIHDRSQIKICTFQFWSSKLKLAQTRPNLFDAHHPYSQQCGW